MYKAIFDCNHDNMLSIFNIRMSNILGKIATLMMAFDNCAQKSSFHWRRLDSKGGRGYFL